MAYTDNIISCRLWELYDNRNLMAIFKDELINEYNTLEIKARLVGEYNELTNVLEVYFNSYRLQTGAGAIPVLYIETVDFKLGNGKAHWYVETIDTRDDGACLFTIKRDTLRDFYSFYSNDTVIIKTASNPNPEHIVRTKNIRYNGQQLKYELTPYTTEIEAIFPYLYGGNTDASWNDGNPKIALIDIVSNKAEELKNINTYIVDGSVGQTSYILSYKDLTGLIKEVTDLTIWEDIQQRIGGTNMQDMITRICLAPFELQGSVIPHETVEQQRGLIPIAKDATIYVTPYTAVEYLDRRRVCTAPFDAPTTGNGYYKIGNDLIIDANVYQAEKVELILPFIGSVDLTSYLRYFNGTAKAQYVIDTLTGNGFVGITRHFDASLTGNINPEYDITIPFNCYRNVSWIGIKSNQVQQAYGAIASIAGVVAGGGMLAGVTGATSSLLSGNTQITQHQSNIDSEGYTRLLGGKNIFYGVRTTLREKGLNNPAFNCERQAFNTLPAEATTAQPTTDYNIITVDIARRAWTGDTEIDNDIYTRLTQGGFVFNG